MIDVLNVATLATLFATSVLTIITLGLIVFEITRCHSRKRKMILMPFLGVTIPGVLLASILTYEELLGIFTPSLRMLEALFLIVILSVFIFALIRLKDIISRPLLISVGIFEVAVFVLYLLASFFSVYPRISLSLLITAAVVVFYFFVVHVLIKTDEKLP